MEVEIFPVKNDDFGVWTLNYWMKWAASDFRNTEVKPILMIKEACI